jgi:hypothetical protein
MLLPPLWFLILWKRMGRSLSYNSLNNRQVQGILSSSPQSYSSYLYRTSNVEIYVAYQPYKRWDRDSEISKGLRSDPRGCTPGRMPYLSRHCNWLGPALDRLIYKNFVWLTFRKRNLGYLTGIEGYRHQEVESNPISFFAFASSSQNIVSML